jgi:hypothetical protein
MPVIVTSASGPARVVRVKAFAAASIDDISALIRSTSALLRPKRIVPPDCPTVAAI